MPLTDTQKSQVGAFVLERLNAAAERGNTAMVVNLLLLPNAQQLVQLRNMVAQARADASAARVATDASYAQRIAELQTIEGEI